MKNLMPKNLTVFPRFKFTSYNFFKNQNNLNHQLKKKIPYDEQYETHDFMFNKKSKEDKNHYDKTHDFMFNKKSKEDKILKCL